MALTEKNYKIRLIDTEIDNYLSVIGAVSIEGPKWCGKTWTAKNHANSLTLLDDENVYDAVKIDMALALNGDIPHLIDEWQRVPELWDRVRREVDNNPGGGRFILTGSTKLPTKIQKEKIFHSGAGRIARLYMHPMSLYESLVSDGQASLMDMYNNTQENYNTKSFSLEEIVYLILRGGWPANIDVQDDKCTLLPKAYLDSLLHDIDNQEDRERDPKKMEMLIRSLARNETTMATDKKILNDIIEDESDSERISSMNTLTDYLSVLRRLHIIEEQPSYSTNYVSRDRVGKNSKRHFTDPSLACAALKLTKDKLLNDIYTLGFMFEALVERDLRVYMNYLGGKLFHFRDNVSKLEVDAVLEFEDGEYAAIEIKLGTNQIEEAKSNLMRYYNLTKKKPKFMAVICGRASYVAKDPETGIYILPITALKP